MIAVVSVALTFGIMLALVFLHAGMANWIQSLNYVAAAFPLALALIQRAKGDAQGKRLFRFHFALGITVMIYGWHKVEGHRDELRRREAQAEADGVESFEHSMNRRHVFDPAAKRWRDEPRDAE